MKVRACLTPNWETITWLLLTDRGDVASKWTWQKNRNWTDLDFMYIQYFFTPRAKGPHVLNKACNLLVIYWKTKGIPKSDNSEKRSSAHKRTKSLRRKYRGQNATLPSTLDSRYEGWVLRIENIHLLATFFNEYNGNRARTGVGKGYWEAKYWHSSKSTWAFPSIAMSYNHQKYLHPYRCQSWKEMKNISEKANYWHPFEAWTSRLNASQLFSIWQRNLDNSSESNF